MPSKSTPSPIAIGEHRPGCQKPDPILMVDGAKRVFGGMTAVDVPHLEIQRGIITALIGPNGAGKTTFFNLLTGFDSPDHGTWTFNQIKTSGKSAYRIAKLGQIRTFQLTKALALLSVMDNMKLGAQNQTGEKFLAALIPPLWRKQEAAIEEKAIEILSRFKLETKKDDLAASLSGGQRKLLEMARALMSDPELIMLDEPMAGVNPALSQSLLGHIVDLKAQGKTVVFVEHDMHMVQTIADWVIVMAEGKVVAEGEPAEVMNTQAVIDAYLGTNKDDDLGDVLAEIKSGKLNTEQIQALLAAESAEIEAEIEAEAAEEVTPPEDKRSH